MSHTIAACSTAPGTGAIGIVRISGPEALDAAGFFFRPKNGLRLQELKQHTVYYGEFNDGDGNTLDLCNIFYAKGPGTYTGEDIAEIYCHGSKALIAEILRCLFGYGVRPAEPGEFTKRAFVNGKMDLAEAEAVIDLISSENSSAVKNAAAQLKGALSGRLKDIRDRLLNLVSHFYAVVDFPDEGVDPFLLDEAFNALNVSAGKLEELTESFGRGQLLTEGIPVSILGKPNVGKSSLLNSLCGEDRDIVTPVAGTTRDVIEARLKMSDLIIRVMDTAGIRESADEIEKIGIERAKSALESSRLAICVFDASLPLDDNDRKVTGLCREIPAIAAINKSDLKKVINTDGFDSLFRQVIEVSAVTGDGIKALTDAIIRETRAESGDSWGGIITNVRQENALKEALLCLKQAESSLRSGMTPDAVILDIEEALSKLGEITGETVREEIVNNIFSRFCVGK
ncbi:MAG: tRNA uridine-5-carboxymethylaminomethyl(34) synthesis GTPase MnmE [Bacillota bacterium]|nr:tRNA uridine-5-carboxymethylaminomethyl(34) synthesis GTPase MnmE [Bacillota bacterium]